MNYIKATKRLTALLLASVAISSVSGSTTIFAEEMYEQENYSFTEEAAEGSSILINDEYNPTIRYTDDVDLQSKIVINANTYITPLKKLIGDLNKANTADLKKVAIVSGLDSIDGTIEYTIKSTKPLKSTPSLKLDSEYSGLFNLTSTPLLSGDGTSFTVTIEVKWGEFLKNYINPVSGSSPLSFYVGLFENTVFPDLSFELQTASPLVFKEVPKVKETATISGNVKSCTMKSTDDAITVTYRTDTNKDGIFSSDYTSSNGTLDTTLNVASPKSNTAKFELKGIHKPNPEKPNQQPTKPILPSGPQAVLRLYNPNTGEHLFTTSEAERINLASLGWNVEGNDWSVPATSDYPIYRVYNPNNGDHHYTTSADEVSALVSYGWISEGTKLYSLTAEDDDNIAIYRMYNPNANGAGSHHYTSSEAECAALQAKGWNFEGLAWYGLKQ